MDSTRKSLADAIIQQQDFFKAALESKAKGVSSPTIMDTGGEERGSSTTFSGNFIASPAVGRAGPGSHIAGGNVAMRDFHA